MERLIEQFKSLISRTETNFMRFLHEKINWEDRLIAILGGRGVGKTTLLLQHIKLHHKLEDTLYVSADDFYFSENRIFELAGDFYKNGGKHLFIDEIHKYSEWSKEIKMLYDNYPELHIVFTGSSVLEIYSGSDDLSRRVLRYYLPGLSFREYLNLNLGLSLPAYSLSDILNQKVDMSIIDKPLMHFNNYLKYGYYPFYTEDGYYQRLNNIVNLTLETDIPLYAKMNISTSKKLKHLLLIISQNVPFKPNMSKIAEIIGVNRNQIADFLYYLESAGIIMQLRDDTKGIRALGKIQKVYLENSNIAYALADMQINSGTLRETFFYNQMKVNQTVVSDSTADFKINDILFEIGGKSKNAKQIKNIKNAFLVKDNIEFGYKNTIPLWHFGLNY